MKIVSCFLLILLAIPDVSIVADTKGNALKSGSGMGSNLVATKGNDKEMAPAVQTVTFPGLAEVGSKAAELTKKADDTRRIISTATNTSSRNQEIDEAEARLQKLQVLISKFSDSDNWDTTNLSHANLLILKEKREADARVAGISSTLAELESTRREWQTQLTFWHEWRVSLSATNSEIPMETFDAVQENLKRVLEELAGAITVVFTIQERASQLLHETVKLAQIVETAFSEQRSNTFKKNESSLFSADFYAQFDLSFWRSIRENFGNFEDPFNARSVWPIAARIFVFFICVFRILSLKGTARIGEDRLFLLDHPWSFGVFMSEALALLFFHQPTGIMQDLSQTAITFSSLILISASLKIRLERTVICFLAALVAVPGVLKLIPLPASLFRLYWTGTALIGVFLLSRWARRMRQKVPQGRAAFLSGCLWWGAFVMALVAAAQVAGFVNLSEKLLFSTLNITFLFIVTKLLLEVNGGMIGLLLEHPLIADIAFIRRFGKELSVRLKTVVNVAICGVAVLFLFPFLGIFSSAGQTFEKLFLSQVTIGGLSLSLALVLSALFVLYLSHFISWVACGLLESEIFPRIEVDRGAGKSVTKLLNYFLVFIGLLIGMGMLGINLKSFAVLGGALGIGVGFGLQTIVNNFISGLILLFERPVKVGDRIEVSTQTGIVKEIGLRSTLIETMDRSELIVPNSKLVSETVTNWTHTGTVARLKIPVRVAYGSDMDAVTDALIAAAMANPRVMAKPEPVALIQGFGEYNLILELRVWVSDVNKRRVVQSEISREIIRRFAESGIDIPFPRQEIRVRYDGNTHPL
ncbi:MAG: mechanosensitive ion channel domain-containing protein [Pseudomonadota bacterium]